MTQNVLITKHVLTIDVRIPAVDHMTNVVKMQFALQAPTELFACVLLVGLAMLMNNVSNVSSLHIGYL